MKPSFFGLLFVHFTHSWGALLYASVDVFFGGVVYNE